MSWTFIAAEQAQLGHQRRERLEAPPVLAFHAQGVRQAPGIDAVGLVAAGNFALAIEFGALRMDGINLRLAFQELLERRSLAGLDRDRKGQEGADFFPPLAPALRGMGEGKIGHDLALGIEHDDVVGVLGPNRSRRSG